MPKDTKSYTPADVARFRELGDITENGVTYDSWMESSAGTKFCLLQQPHHTENDMSLAKLYLKRDRDVIGITVAAVVPQSNADGESDARPTLAL
jgi:hypothetical protein